MTEHVERHHRSSHADAIRRRRVDTEGLPVDGMTLLMGTARLILILAVLLGSAVVAILIMLGARYLAPPGGFLVDPVPASSVFGVLGVAFAVLLAFVVFLAFEGYVRAVDGASREAVAVSQLVRVSRLLPDEPGDQLRGDLACYARAVVTDEWPAMAGGHESVLVAGWLDRIETTIDALPIDDARTEVAVSHWLDEMAVRREGRRSRISHALPEVPEAVWLTLLVGAVLTIGYLVVYANPRDRWWVQALMIGSVTMLVVAELMVVVYLDRPFQQDGAFVGPGEMRATIRLLDEDYADEPAYERPCDDQGRPVAPA